MALPVLHREPSPDGHPSATVWGLLFVLLALAVCLPVLVLDLEGRADVPDAPPAPAAEDVTVLDALAVVLGPGTGNDPVGRILAGASLEQKVAQLFVVGFPGTGPADAGIYKSLTEAQWGGVLLQRGNVINDRQARALVRGIGAIARREKSVPPLIATPQDGTADAPFVGAPPGPPPKSGAKGPGAVEREATRAGRRLKKLGIDMTLAPIADVATEGGVFEDSTFGIDPDKVAIATKAAVDGYGKAGVIAAVRSFPGAGGASQDPDLGPAPVGLNLPELVGRDLKPFAAVARTAPVVVMSNAIYVAFDGVTPPSVLPDAYRLLRTRLRYRGVTMTGDLVTATGATGGTVSQAAIDAVKAGADLLLVPGSAADQRTAYAGVLAAVRSGQIGETRIETSLRRILELKQRYGVLRP